MPLLRPQTDAPKQRAAAAACCLSSRQLDMHGCRHPMRPTSPHGPDLALSHTQIPTPPRVHTSCPYLMAPARAIRSSSGASLKCGA
eukprot:357996-Chlamydomonas_euryale.AAC.1